MNTNSLYKSLILSLCMTSFYSCTQEKDPENFFSSKGLKISAHIENKDGGLQTRVNLNRGDGEDQWSFSRFSDTPFPAKPYSQKENADWEWEEALGFYSNRGNLDLPGSGSGSTAAQGGPFTNEKMVFGSSLEDNVYSTFISTDMNVDLQGLRSGAAAYFPYTEEMEDKGLELRWVNNGESLERCIDALIMRQLNTSGNTGSGLSIRFYHAFSEMIITRGEGFDNPPAQVIGDNGETINGEKIVIVLKEGYSHAKLVDYEKREENPVPNYNKIFKLVYDENYSKTDEECRRWETWKGTFLSSSSGNTTNNIKDAWYALVPGSFDWYRPQVDYIEIYDNNGELHKITDFTLFDQKKSLNWNERYVLEIKMEGLVPTVSPVLITPWGADTYVAQRLAAGISNSSEFERFVETYNSYNSPQVKRNSNKYEEILSKYGDMTLNETTGGKYWNFYFNGDFQFTAKNSTITLLHSNDIIDGLNNNLTNVTSQFITTLEGTLQNLNFTVNIKDENITTFYGPIAKSINNGIITGCNITGTVNCPNAEAVGMLAGSISENEAKVENCSFSGLLIGKSVNDKIIALPTSSDYGNNNSSSGIIFSNN